MIRQCVHVKALETMLDLEERLTQIEDEQAQLEKAKKNLWKRVFEHFDMNGTNRVVLPNGMILARVLQHRTTYNENMAQSILPSSEWPKITKRVIDAIAYEHEKDMGVITPEQDARICSVKELWVPRHQAATKQELRELKGAE